MRAGGLDLAGPWPSEGSALAIELEVEEGAGADVAVVCRAEAERIAAAYLARAYARPRSPLVSRAVTRGAAVELRAEPPESCDEVALVVTPRAAETVRFRYRVRRESDEAQTWITCGARAR